MVKIFDCKFHLRFICNPIVRYKADNMGNYRGVNLIKREVPLIVSLTSFEERFSDLEISLYSLLNQSIKPDRLILWLSDEYSLSELPYEITRFIKNGLEIRFVRDIKSYTKIYYALKEFSDSIIVTADDDIYYPADWLEKLYHSYAAHPENIHAHRAHRVVGVNKKGVNRGEACSSLPAVNEVASENVIIPYEQWEKHVQEETARFDNFLTGVGGVLYPPNCFKKEVLREDIFLNNAPNADDIWLWVMALISDRKIRVVKNHIDTLTCTNIWRQLGLNKGKTLYSMNKAGGNDIQLQNLMKYYKQNVISKLL